MKNVKNYELEAFDYNFMATFHYCEFHYSENSYP